MFYTCKLYNYFILLYGYFVLYANLCIKYRHMRSSESHSPPAIQLLGNIRHNSIRIYTLIIVCISRNRNLAYLILSSNIMGTTEK